MPIVDLRGRENEPAVLALLAAAQIHRDNADAIERAPAIAKDYASPGSLRLWGDEEAGAVLGIVGIELRGEGAAIVRDLAVEATRRRSGIGRLMLDFLRGEAGLTRLEGDTLASAGQFYERCGFVVQEDGTMPDGQVRFRFVWSARNQLTVAKTE